VTDFDAREELSTLVAALRAHAEHHVDTGALGLPAATPEFARARVEILTPSAVTPTGAAGPEDREAPGAPQAIDDARVAVSSVDRGDVATRLRVLEMEARACTRCVLHQERKQAVFSRGTGSSGLCFVGEGPGADEDEQGAPFVGKAGQLLDRMIEAMGLGRDEVYVCNIVKCRPPNNRKPEPDEMAACRPYLAEQLDLLEPKVIVALGATAVEGLLGIGGGITRLRGTWRLYKGRIAVMPTFHPAYLLRTPEAKREVWQDLQEVVRHMGRTLPARK
jgi:DNA polymerase